jgi:hypothetical protein
MNKREFLTAAVAGALPLASARAAASAGGGPGLLTVSGALERPNRGPFDPALDQLTAKHGVAFSRAFEFDAAALQRLPAVTIRPTLEYDARIHALSGPLLATVLEAAGAASDDELLLGLRALDGYKVELSLADARRYRMIVATHVDGQPLPLGGLGPQWAVYEADTLAPFRDRPLAERFALCPWGLYHIEVKRA